MNNILVFADNQYNRTVYIVEILLQDFQGINVQFARSLEEFLNSDLPKLSYCKKGFEKIPNIFNSEIVENEKIFEPKIPLKNDFELNKLHIDFDIFAFCFFVLSRAEEYNSPYKDKHNRFSSQNSILTKYNILHIPVVDIFSEELKKWLLIYYPSLKFNRRKQLSMLTIDIDIAYALKAKPYVRQIGGAAKELFSLNFKNLKNRISVVCGNAHDPYDVYDYLEKTLSGSGVPSVFFFQVRSKGKYDKAVNIKTNAFVQLVKRVSEFADIGIHPSYSGGQNPQNIKAEKCILEDITGKKVTYSRHHYLKLHIPQTPKALVEAGITHDFTMGFADALGWRAGTCSAFRFFDISENKVIPLFVYPISFMDGTLQSYLSLNTEEAIIKANEIIQCVQKYNGIFIPLWHNESLSQTGRWSKWRSDVFEIIFEKMKAINKNIHNSVLSDDKIH